MHILVIEDSPEFRRSMVMILKSAGHSVSEGGTLLEGIHLATEHPPDVVLLDLQLPDSHGSASVMRFAETGLPIVVLTGMTDESTLRGCIAAGAVDVLHKPTRTAELLHTLIRAHALAEARPLPSVLGGIIRDGMLKWAAKAT